MICAVYPANEEWHLTGEGEMISEDRIDRELTEKYRELTPAMQELIDKMIDLLNEQQERENKKISNATAPKGGFLSV